MGGELVATNSPSQITTVSEFFENQCPYYLSIGLSVEDFWDGDGLLPKYYRKSAELSRARRNEELWLQGLYFYEALCNVSPVLQAFAKSGTTPLPYPKAPYPITKMEIDAKEKEKQQERIRKAKQRFEIWVAQLDLPDKLEVEDTKE